MSDESIELAPLIRQLRSELESAMMEGEGQALRFELESVDLELEFVATKAAEGKVGFKFWVVGSASAAAKLGYSSTQKLKLSLKPRAAGGGPVLVSDETQRRR